MLNKNFEKIFNLSKKTGDKFIVLPDFGDPFVIVPFTEYEKIINLTPDVKNLSEEELLDKINRDIAIWKDYQELDHEESALDLPYYTKTDLNNEDLLEEVDEMEEENWLNPLKTNWELEEDVEEEESLTNPWLEELTPEFTPDSNLETKDTTQFETPEKQSTSSEDIPSSSNNNHSEEIWFQPPPKKSAVSTESETNIKYEEIPPPPSLSPTLNQNTIIEEKNKIIDLSFEDAEKPAPTESETEAVAVAEEFAEEPVY